VWFYYSWGFSVFPIVVVTWFANKLMPTASEATAPIAALA